MPVARLDHRAAVSVSGESARSFLQGLLTQDVETLADGEVRYGALLGPQGRLLIELFLHGRAEGVLIDCPADQRDALIQRLTLYRLRAKAQISADDRPVLVAWGADAASDGPVDPRLPGLGHRRVGEGQADASESAWLEHQLSLGVPDARDMKPDADYPIECDLDLLNGIAFHKGCFVGQETTSRMKRRGAIRTRLIPVTFDGPVPAVGTEVLNGELRAGEIRSGQGGRAMALLRLDRIGGVLTAGGMDVRADPPAWLGLNRP